MADVLVRIRIVGPSLAVAVTSERVRCVLAVASESRNYPLRDGPGVRRYLDVLIAADEPPAEEARGG